MKISRSITAVVVVVVVMGAILAFVYGVPSGRRARRGTLRAFRLARNTTGIYPLPVLTVRMWNGTPHGLLMVEVYASGRLVVSDRGERIERQLTRDAAERIIEIGKDALGDFSSHSCGTKPGGLNSALYVLIDGTWTGSVCRDASDWPHGFEIKRLRGISQPQYRLRVGDIRVFYDVTETQVQVLAIVTKAEAQAWLDEEGTPSPKGPAGGTAGGNEG